MIDNTHNLNRQIAVTMAICTTFLICLLLLDFFAVFNFSEELMFAISVIGIPTLISPLILCFFKVPDKFLKYYMSVAMSVLIGMFGCFNDIGIYITFVLVPVASCLYFDVYYTMFCSVFSYIVMVISVYLNSAGRLEITYLGWSHLETFSAYLIGFTLEYLVITLFLALLMKRANKILDEQHQAYLKEKAQDARYQLLVKETTDVVFEYYPKNDKYIANRSVYQKESEHNEHVEYEKFSENMESYPEMHELYECIKKGFREENVEKSEIDMSYDKSGSRVELWYRVECFVVKDGNMPVSVIGKLHDITRIKQAQMSMRRQRIENMYHDHDIKRKNSLFEQVMAESDKFNESDYNRMAEGHNFLAEIMEDVKYSKDLFDGINQMFSRVGKFFGIDRICVVETDMSSGTCYVNYQWNSRKENYLKDYFTSMSIEQIQKTTETYDKNGYIEINPDKQIHTATFTSKEFLDNIIFSIILGNQLWIPMLDNGKYIGAISFDRYDTTPYTAVEKFLISEAVNTLTAHILKINADNANRAKSDFLSTMSHEIRTPMNAIIGMTEVALREDMSESVKKSLSMVKSSAFSLLTLINDILDYSKIESGKFDIVPESFYVLSVLNDVKEITMARNKGKLDIEFEVPENIPAKMYGDFVRIKQVMINYCTNAIKYSDKGKVRVRVAVQKRDEKNAMLHFSVKDNGIGIKKEDLAKLFKAYTRLDSKINHHKEGTGLGLAISKQLIELMNGVVSVRSEYGKGSTFSFALPIIIEDWTPAGRLEDYQYEEENDEKANEISVVTAPDAHILVVDDTKLNLVVATALMEPTQMHIDMAESGEQALKMIDENDYDLIFMDHFMPGMDGVETTARIRDLSDENKRELPVIALTADAMKGVKEELISKGMSDFLTKPIVIGDLYKMLRKWLPEEKIC